MKEPYGEGVASRTGSESCVDSRKAGHEALTGVHAGGVLSREMLGNQSADAVPGELIRWQVSLQCHIVNGLTRDVSVSYS